MKLTQMILGLSLLNLVNACGKPDEQKNQATQPQSAIGTYENGGISSKSAEANPTSNSQPGPASADGAVSRSEAPIASGASPSSVEGSRASKEASPTAPVIDVDGGGKAADVQAGLTAAAYNDALNLDDFMSYLGRAAKIKLPEQAPFQFSMKKEDIEALLPKKPDQPFTKIDISLVLDVTGSMGDEMKYLQREWKAIIDDLKILLPELQLRFSFVAYRDTTDAFVTKSLGFTPSVDAFQTEMAKYNAAGGGDFPEAVEEAFVAGNALEWAKDADTKKLLFWVADAPAHDDKEVKAIEEILKVREKGITIYPIAASGVADKTEITMRLAALLTGGEYIFLTDDSGIGNTHAEPHIRCYNVERLNQLLLRILTREATGKAPEIKKENILRTVGKPNNGVCETVKAEVPAK